jgi:hypothetical protein
LTTRRCRCWHRAPARPRPGGCGPTSATSGRSPVLARRRRCSSTRPTARASTQRHICRTFAASFTPTAIPGSTGCSPETGSPRLPAGPMSAANSSTSCRQRLGDRQASPRPHRRSLRRRKDDHRPAARPAARRAPDAVEAVRRNAARLDRHHLAEALAQIRTGQGVPLHAVALEGAAAMP